MNMPELPEKLELLVVADEWADAVSRLAEVDVHQKTKTHLREVKGLYILEISKQRTDLTEEFYEKIRDHKSISIISDSASIKRSESVLKEVYKVETELRKLLLHIYDLVEAYFNIFDKTSYAKKIRTEQINYF